MTGGRAGMGDGVELWWQGCDDGPVVLLVPGRGDSSDLDPPEFSDAPVAAGFAVLRFDLRDTGLSDDGGDGYPLADMAAGIAGADPRLVDRMGHLPTPAQWGVLADLVVGHLRAAA